MKKPIGYRTILTVQNAKTTKGEALGYLTAIFYGSPADESGVMNTCVSSTPQCRALCLKKSGRLVFDSSRKAAIEKTVMLFNNRALFLDCVRYDIEKAQRHATKLGLELVVRLNGMTDLPWLSQTMAREYPGITFYDYTKHIRPWQREMSNYRLTFSHSEENLAGCLDAMDHGVNVAVVFDTKRGDPLPETWHGYPVIDGDTHDLRFLDPKGVIVGLRAKGVARKAEASDSGFIQIGGLAPASLPVAA